MKKAFGLIILLLFVLVGCGQGGGATNVVKDMYNAAANNNSPKLEKILSFYDGNFGDIDEVAYELRDEMQEFGGLKKMNIGEVPKKQLQPEVVTGLNDYFDNWSVVLVEIGDDYYVAWIVQKIDGKPYVVSGEDFNRDEILKN